MLSIFQILMVSFNHHFSKQLSCIAANVDTVSLLAYFVVSCNYGERTIWQSAPAHASGKIPEQICAAIL
jgi:hypothetical protein